MAKLMQNSKLLLIQQVIEAVKNALEQNLDDIVNLAYRQGFSDGIEECRDVKSRDHRETIVGLS